MNQKCKNSLPNINMFQSNLLELVKEGVLLVAYNFRPTYLNKKAIVICQNLSEGNVHQLDQLPLILWRICHQLFKESNHTNKSFFIDYQVKERQTISIRAYYFIQGLDQKLVEPFQEEQYILIFLEDRNALLEEELLIEQTKYNLTSREKEILQLLAQKYSYQEIARTLYISLNTVKFHIKKIYAKKRTFLEQKM